MDRHELRRTATSSCADGDSASRGVAVRPLSDGWPTGRRTRGSANLERPPPHCVVGHSFHSTYDDAERLGRRHPRPGSVALRLPLDERSRTCPQPKPRWRVGRSDARPAAAMAAEGGQRTLPEPRRPDSEDRPRWTLPLVDWSWGRAATTQRPTAPPATPLPDWRHATGRARLASVHQAAPRRAIESSTFAAALTSRPVHSST